MNTLATASLPLLLLLFASARLAAQSAEPLDADRPATIGHRLVVKVAASGLPPVEYARGVLEPAVGRFGITAVGSWLNPALLAASPSRALPRTSADAGNAGLRSLSRIVLVTYTEDIPPERVAAAIGALPGVEYAEPLFRRSIEYTPDDAQIDQQWYLEQVSAYDAWDNVRADATIVIAIVDTGIDPTHPDLKDAIWINPGENGLDARGRSKRTNGVDDDGNGLVDDWHGYDFGGGNGYTPDNDPSPGYWHGTHVAGIAAASGDNGIGITGIAYGARLMAVKVSDDATSDPTLTAGPDGILYAAKMGADIINCSWGGAGYAQAEQELVNTVTAMGSMIVSAAGNDGRAVPSYPASYRSVLSVASVRSGDQRSSFSNFNPSVGIAAPGENIYSTVPPAYSASGYMISRGTSMATPVVSGAAALLLRKYPELTPEQIGAVLRATADNIDDENPDYRFQLGDGRVNIARALSVGPNAVAATILDYAVIEEQGDGVIEPGETIEMRIDVKNLLRPTENLRLTLAASSDSVQIITPEETFGVMESGEVRQSRTGVFRLMAPAGAPFDYPMNLQLTLFEGNVAIGRKMVELVVGPNYATTAYNRTAVTFTGNGRIGFNDFPNNQKGSGFRFDSSGTLLAEGGLLIGVAPDRLADVVHGADPFSQNRGLRTVEPYRVHFSENEGAEVGTARFDDGNLQEGQRMGIDVRMKTMQFRDSAAGRQTLVFYTIRNTTAVPLNNLFCALFLDWDIGTGGAYDRTQIDLADRLGYTLNTRLNQTPLAGAMLLSGQPMNFYALDNGSGYPLGNGFYQLEKWDVISNGIRREESSVGDCSMTIGAGPIDLAPGADTVVAFSLMAGANLGELRMAAEDARTRFIAMGGTPGGPIDLPRELRLVDSYPNPFVGHTTLEFQIAEEGRATLDVFNILGEHIATLASGFYRKGTHPVVFTPPADGASEVYIVRLVAGDQVVTQKLIRLSP